jgi:hypothetical protein
MMLRLVPNDVHPALTVAPVMFDLVRDDNWGVSAMTEHEKLRQLARRLAEVLPHPGPELLEDATSRARFADLVDLTVDALIVAADENRRLLQLAAGPPVQVGVRPTWHSLLDAAQSRCRTETASTPKTAFRSLSA